MKGTKSYTVSEIREKLAKYCTYQDRCHWEVENKLNEFRLIPEARDEILLFLIENKFLNEERFAKSFARGKFNQKKWGKVKIRIELKKRKISPKLIETALKEIDYEDYEDTIRQLYEKKKLSLKSEKNELVKKTKIRNYLLQKGYESDVIQDVIKL